MNQVKILNYAKDYMSWKLKNPELDKQMKLYISTYPNSHYGILPSEEFSMAMIDYFNWKHKATMLLINPELVLAYCLIGDAEDFIQNRIRNHKFQCLFNIKDACDTSVEKAATFPSETQWKELLANFIESFDIDYYGMSLVEKDAPIL